MKRREIFRQLLAVVSILGFLSILFNSLFEVNAAGWIDSVLFVLIGVGLMIIGGVRMVWKYFENGLTDVEISKILTIIVGIFSTIVGILIMPVDPFGVMDAPQLGGVKAVIAVLTITIIMVETWVRK